MLDLMYLCQPQARPGHEQQLQQQQAGLGLQAVHLAHNNLGGWNGEYGKARSHPFVGGDWRSIERYRQNRR